MKTPILKTLTLILTLCALSASALNVFAQNFVVTSDTTVSGTHYENKGTGTAALTNSTVYTFTGSNIVLTGTAASGNGRYGMIVNRGGMVSLTDSAINSVHYGIASGTSSTVVLDNTNIITGGTTAYGINLTTSSTLAMTGGTITTGSTGARGVSATGASSVSLQDTVIDSYSAGVYLGGTSVGTLNNVNIINHEGSSVDLATSSSVSIVGGTIINSTGVRGVSALTGARASLRDLYIEMNAARAIGVAVGAESYAELNDVNIAVTGISGTNTGEGINVSGSGADLAGNRVNITSNYYTVVVNTGTATFNDSVFVGTGSVPLFSVGGRDSHLLVNGGTAVSTGGGEMLRLVSNGPIGVEFNEVDLSAAGGVFTSTAFSGSATVSVNGGSGINGDVTNSGSGALIVNLDHSSLTGDITNQGDGVLVITLDNNSTGAGGYNGGDLTVGGDSAWTFTKDSHGNYGENNGVWNIGDYEVIFDNMTHTGTVNLSVNSDTGAGGSITVTGTADGDGTVHIDTTGDGKLNPNDVLPGIVSGDGTEHWQWDPIDWGIDTIIKDGDHFIKNGTSPVGAVLNSAIAVQQSMWFAQQNSLLKRMGELRYGTRASRPPAGGTPALHIIDNIWLRSYGQQLNVGSKVAGKAYEQLIYGVDVGTDHKFTLSADSDLYLGVYAGYGRSDLDYRTPGTDGELNSYYGGLYATWLHSSGFYIDATVKAASVDNDLKAPYGATQLTANYSDVNIGGSLEIGKKFTFSDDWFIEPQFQVNYLHILAEDYQAGPMSISAQDLDALQLRIGSLFGRTLKLANGGALQPYVKISGVETISSGGTLRNGYQSTRANTDGARAELGAGVIWQLDTNNQLHLDYEASFGDKYDKPWGLTAGYRHQF